MALPNFAEYVVPGEYWEATPTPVAPQSLYTVNQVALVGPGIGYQTFAENVTFNATTPVALTQLGINIDTIVVTSLDGTVVGVLTTDYTVTSSAATDGHSQDTTTTITWVSGTFTNHETVRVSYQYTDYDYLTPSICTNLAQVQSLYGNGIDITSGEVTSPLSLAAQFAFTNGAQTLVLVATPNATVVRADLTNAYAFLEVLDNVNLVVPLPVNLAYANAINVGQDLASFLRTDETTNDILRVGLLGFEVGTDSNVGYDPATVAAAVAYKRVVEAWPWAMNYYNGYTNSTLVVGGYYLAAAYAGLFAGNQPQQGLTRQSIKNFTGIPSSVFQTMTTALKNQYGAAGVAVAEISRAGVLWCRHGTTTDPSSIYNQEASLVREQDAMVTLLEGAVEQAGIIGKPIDANATVNLQALTIGILEQCVQLGIIYGYQGVVAQQLSNTPTTIQVTFEWQPSYPLNYVTFIFSVNTTTGVVSAGTATGQTS